MRKYNIHRYIHKHIFRHISPWALVIAILFFLAPIILRLYGSDLIADRMLKDEVWKIHFIPAVIISYYLGIKGAIFVAVLSVLSAIFVEVKLIILYGKNYSVFVKHVSLEIFVIMLYTITLGLMSEKLKKQQRQLTSAYDKLTQLAVLEERNNIARDLHDGLAQSLGSMNLKLIAMENSLNNKKNDSVREELAASKEILDEAYAEIRHHIFGLNYKFDSKEPFSDRLKKFFNKYSKTSGIHVHYNINIKSELELPLKVQLNLFRIIQEALANVRKHALVTEVQVSFSIAKSALIVCIKDEGRGFDKNSLAQQSDSFGLTIMSQRADAIGAAFTVESQLDKGTSILIMVPLTNLEG